MMRRWRLKIALVGGLWALAHAASAQWLGGDYATYGAPYSNYAASSFMNQTFMNQAAMKRGKAAAVRQVRGILAASGPFVNASPADKRQAYEQMAMVGVFMRQGASGSSATPTRRPKPTSARPHVPT